MGSEGFLGILLHIMLLHMYAIHMYAITYKMCVCLCASAFLLGGWGEGIHTVFRFSKGAVVPK